MHDGSIRSALAHLEGSLSGQEYPSGEAATVDPIDGRPLLCRYDVERARATLTRDSLARRRSGLWRWSELLPVQGAAARIHLGEGATPLVQAPRLGEALGVPNLLIKAEGLNPTGSFKARGMAVAVSRAIEQGARLLIVPSAGNAGGALAAYAAARGVPAIVLMPDDVPDANRTEAVVSGARVLLVNGLIDDCAKLAAQLSLACGGFNLSTFREPGRVEGKKTMAFELAEDLEWTLPDVIVYPTGGGTGLVAMWKAFDELEQLGLIDSRRPRLVSVQAEGCAPIVRAFEDGRPFAERWADARTRAAGIRVPISLGDFLVLRALRESEGFAVAVDERATDRMQALAATHGIGYVSPETSAALAAVERLRSASLIGHRECVVLFDTGVGYKYPPPPGLAAPTVLGSEAADEALDLVADLVA